MPRVTLDTFEKKCDFLFCTDSDGCAIDTMTSKHQQAFAPRLIETYNLEPHRALVTREWLSLNLYSATRGVNRFKGLTHMMDFLALQGIELEGRAEYLAWVAAAPILSNDTLRAGLEQGAGSGLAKALEWSLAVNETVAAMGDALPFPGCQEALAQIRAQADTAVVSAANSEAVTQEWSRCGLAQYMDLLMGQDAGSKAYCLKQLVSKGYAPHHVLMSGDALGDLDAARQAGVLFFPILVGREAESWAQLHDEAFPRFLAGTFAGAYQAKLIADQKALLR